jgi:hypothetical protein
MRVGAAILLTVKKQASAGTGRETKTRISTCCSKNI